MLPEKWIRPTGEEIINLVDYLATFMAKHAKSASSFPSYFPLTNSLIYPFCRKILGRVSCFRFSSPITTMCFFPVYLVSLLSSGYSSCRIIPLLNIYSTQIKQA